MASSRPIKCLPARSSSCHGLSRLPGLGRTETVRRGDTLAAIATRNKLKLGDIVAANPDLDPDKI